jgi:hypothetical protein
MLSLPSASALTRDQGIHGFHRLVPYSAESGGIARRPTPRRGAAVKTRAWRLAEHAASGARRVLTA